jgi:hypothetical protein
MNEPHNRPKLEARVNTLIDDRLFKAFWDAAEHFKTTDLVVCFDDSLEEDPVSIFLREKLIRSEDVPTSLRSKLRKPAQEAQLKMSVSETVFWLVAIFRDGGMACVAINAKHIAPGGNA